ncbi:MAG: 8-oxo-dGTP diphosphatase MutT [Pseudomonadota bacterium]
MKETVSALQVVIGILINAERQVLIARRPEHKPFSGLWEFPGGKIETGETALQALKRELDEEIGISVIQASPLLQVSHRYAKRDVLLDVWQVDQYRGDVTGAEGQAIQWCAIEKLRDYNYPEASETIIDYLQSN